MNYNTLGNNTTLNSDIAKITPKEILQGYGAWIKEFRDAGWDGYLISFMFKHISGSSVETVREMHREIERVYGKLASRVVRKPKSAKFAHLLPRAVFFPDVPCPKKDKQELGDVTVNDGIHVHGIVVVPKNSRLKVPLDQHFREKKRMYTRRGKITRIHVQPIVFDEMFVTDYAGKAYKKRRVSGDEILVLPKSLKELPQKMSRVDEAGSLGREIKDVMSAYNVSEAVAQGIHQAKIRPAARRR
jgi:hypothetical protein